MARFLGLGLAVALSVVLGACAGSVPPTGDFGDPNAPDLVEPPEARINGVAGKPISWCWEDAGCADGFIWDPFMLPFASAPYVIEMPAGARIEAASAHQTGPDAPSTELRVDGVTLTDVPEGATFICAQLLAGSQEYQRDAHYCWSIVDAVSSTSPSP